MRVRNADKYWDETNQCFVFNWEKIARETGYTVDEVKLNSVAWCRVHPKI